MIISTLPDFNLKSTVYSHGWCTLPPFSVETNSISLQRVFELSTGKLISTKIEEQRAKNGVRLNLTTSLPISLTEKKELITKVRTCLRLDEDYSSFYLEANKHNAFHWVSSLGAGRLLRSPTVFEDVVKMICTTNCSWALTEIMVGNLCAKLGKTGKEGTTKSNSFPTPEAIAGTTEKYLRKEIRAGYRAPYLLELSMKIVNGDLEIESWRTSTLPTEELFKVVRSVKGIGPYAAGNILKLLGRYDYLALDSWGRKKFFEKHKNGKKTTDRVIEKYYHSYGQWRGLFFWLDMTQYWYEREFVF